jgi:hypothetical protein
MRDLSIISRQAPKFGEHSAQIKAELGEPASADSKVTTDSKPDPDARRVHNQALNGCF